MKESAEELLADYIEINSPGRLIDVASSLSIFIKNGTLIESAGECSVIEIVPNASWPCDLIDIEFTTVPGGTKYVLRCETYRGVGGFFSKLAPKID
jgi:hypothetical protein